MIKKILKWGGIVVGSLLGVIILVGIALYVIGSAKLNKTYDVSVESIAIQPDSVTLVHGAYLVETQGCMFCHGEDLSGQMFIEDGAMGILPAPNLTGGEGGVGGKYSDSDWVRSIRHGISPEGRSLIIMPSHFYSELSVRDLGALIAYIKQLPRVDNVLAARNLGPVPRLVSVFDAAMLTATLVDHDKPFLPDPTQEVSVAYGRYKANLCRGCHGSDLTGGTVNGPPGTPPSRNITPDPASGIGNWTEADFFGALRKGVRPSGDTLHVEMPRFLGKMTDDELRAIWLYLRDVEPIYKPLVGE